RCFFLGICPGVVEDEIIGNFRIESAALVQGNRGRLPHMSESSVTDGRFAATAGVRLITVPDLRDAVQLREGRSEGGECSEQQEQRKNAPRESAKAKEGDVRLGKVKSQDSIYASFESQPHEVTTRSQYPKAITSTQCYIV